MRDDKHNNMQWHNSRSNACYLINYADELLLLSFNLQITKYCHYIPAHASMSTKVTSNKNK